MNERIGPPFFCAEFECGGMVWLIEICKGVLNCLLSLSTVDGTVPTDRLLPRWYGTVEVCEGAPVAVGGWVLADRHDRT